jgi:fucose permease
MSDPVIIIVDVVVLALVAGAVRTFVNTAVRGLSTLVGVAALVLIVAILTGADVSGLPGKVTDAFGTVRSWLPHLTSTLNTLVHR